MFTTPRLVGKLSWRGRGGFLTPSSHASQSGSVFSCRADTCGVPMLCPGLCAGVMGGSTALPLCCSVLHLLHYDTLQMWPRGLKRLRCLAVTQMSGDGTRSSSRFASIALAKTSHPSGCSSNAQPQRVHLREQQTPQPLGILRFLALCGNASISLYSHSRSMYCGISSSALLGIWCMPCPVCTLLLLRILWNKKPIISQNQNIHYCHKAWGRWFATGGQITVSSKGGDKSECQAPSINSSSGPCTPVATGPTPISLHWEQSAPVPELSSARPQSTLSSHTEKQAESFFHFCWPRAPAPSWGTWLCCSVHRYSCSVKSAKFCFSQ